MEENGKWVTIDGNHVLIEDKESKDQSVTNEELKPATIDFSNRKNLTDSIEQQINVDLEKASTENQFAPRRGLNIDSRKLLQNDFNALRYYLDKNDVRMESNGVNDYFIYYKKD